MTAMRDSVATNKAMAKHYATTIGLLLIGPVALTLALTYWADGYIQDALRSLSPGANPSEVAAQAWHHVRIYWLGIQLAYLGAITIPIWYATRCGVLPFGFSMLCRFALGGYWGFSLA